MSYLLDTTLIIDHVKAHPEGTAMLARLFEETSALYTCDVITSEALSGGDDPERRAILNLLDALEYVALDPIGARWAGIRRRELARSGHRHPLADALIAATAKGIGATVVTRNASDFERFGVPVLGYGEQGQASAGTKRGSTP